MGMAEDDPEQLADALDHEADRLERRSREVKDRVDAARADWERKRRDESIPGAAPPDPDEEDEAAGAEEDPG
jgi:hypothetical protein